MSEDEPRGSHEGERLGPVPPVPAVAIEEAGPLRRLVGLATIDLGAAPAPPGVPPALRRASALVLRRDAHVRRDPVPGLPPDRARRSRSGSSAWPRSFPCSSRRSSAARSPTPSIVGACSSSPSWALGLATAILFFNSLLDEPKVWVLFVVTPLMAAIDGFQRPALDAMVPRLVSRDELTAASALDSLRGEFGMIAGPAVGGDPHRHDRPARDLRHRHRHIWRLGASHSRSCAPFRRRRTPCRRASAASSRE